MMLCVGSTALLSLVACQAEVGVTAPLGFFDPAGFCNNVDKARSFEIAKKTYGSAMVVFSMFAMQL